MKTCQRCQTINPDNSLFCARCGAGLVGAPPAGYPMPPAPPKKNVNGLLACGCLVLVALFGVSILIAFGSNPDKYKTTTQSQTSKQSEDQAGSVVNTGDKYREELARQVAEHKSPCPLDIIAGGVEVDSAGVSHAYVQVKNLSAKTVDAYDVEITCRDRTGNDVEHYLHHTNIFIGREQSTVKPGRKSRTADFYLHGYQGCTVALTQVKSAWFTDGSSWSGQNCPQERLVTRD